MAKITQEKIIETAESLIAKTHASEVTLSQISDKLGITHAALYKHFKSKQQLWEAVADNWFNKNILDQINIDISNYHDQRQLLHDWLWEFANAKKKAYNDDPQMFALNTRYVDSQPLVLQNVLWSSYKIIDQFMSYHDTNYERAEAILSAFTVFNLPTFAATWNLPNYHERFEQLWQLIEHGV